MSNSNSREYAVIKKCIQDIELAFKMDLKDISVFLFQAQVLTKDTYNTVTSAISKYSPLDKAHLIVEALSDAVEQDQDIYYMFVDYLKTNPIKYKAILKRLSGADPTLDQKAGLQEWLNNNCKSLQLPVMQGKTYCRLIASVVLITVVVTLISSTYFKWSSDTSRGTPDLHQHEPSPDLYKHEHSPEHEPSPDLYKHEPSPKTIFGSTSDDSFPIKDKYDLLLATNEVGNWMSLCANLRVSDGVINGLKFSAKENIWKKNECLTYYFKNNDPHWKDVVKVVAGYPIDNLALACRIAKKFMNMDKKTCYLLFDRRDEL